MPATMPSLMLDLLEKACVVMVVAYFIGRTRYLSGLVQGSTTVRNQLVLVAVFGALAIYGTYGGVPLPSGAIANIRDLGPMAAGMVGGPLVGLGAGLIGGIHRYFIGGLTQVPCSIATALAGLIAGLVFRAGGYRVRLWVAALVAIAMESVHMGLILAIARPFDDALGVVTLIALPMALGNAAGLVVFAYVVRNVNSRLKLETLARVQAAGRT